MLENLSGIGEPPFRLHQVPGYISTIYLLEYPYGMLLLDCGSASDIPRIEAVCRDIGRSPHDIRLAVATHAHPDHMGGATMLRRKYAIPIAAHPDIDRWYQGIGGYIQHKVDCFFANWVAMKSGRCPQSTRYNRSINADYQITGGQKVPIFDDWEVLFIPGHTMHDIALYHPDSKMLYMADSICSANGKIHLPVPVLYPELMRQSLMKMVALDPQQILLAHGGPISITGPELLRQQVDELLNREVKPDIDRLLRWFFISQEARRGRQRFDGRL